MAPTRTCVAIIAALLLIFASAVPISPPQRNMVVQSDASLGLSNHVQAIDQSGTSKENGAMGPNTSVADHITDVRRLITSLKKNSTSRKRGSRSQIPDQIQTIIQSIPNLTLAEYKELQPSLRALRSNIYERAVWSGQGANANKLIACIEKMDKKVAEENRGLSPVIISQG